MNRSPWLFLLIPAISVAGPPVLEPIVVTPAREAEPRFESDRSFVSEDEVRRTELQAVQMPELLDETPGVIVQRTSRGAGAPYIRGLIGPQNLIVVDGVRINTSLFRTGPNQYLALFDPYGMAAMEIVRGPSSVLYGNGAMGGVMHLLTLSPEVGHGAFEVGGTVAAHFASADLAGGGSANVTATSGDAALLVGGTFDHFGTLRVGGGDEVPLSGYRSGFWRAKAVYEPGDWSLTGGYFGGLIDGAGRTDKLGGGEVRVTGNVDHLAYLSFDWRGTGVVRRVKALAAYQALFEHTDQSNCKDEDKDKIVDDLGRCSTLDDAAIASKRRTDDDVHVIGGEASVQLGFFGDRLRVTTGAEAYQDFVASTREDAKAADGFVFQEKPRGNFSDDSRYLSAGAFVHARGTVYDAGKGLPKLRLSAGTRFSHFAAFAPDVPGVGDVDYDFNGFVFSGGVQLLVPRVFTLYGSFVQGFRAPNLQETTVLGNTGAIFEVPSPDLAPERSDTFEVGARGRAGPIDVSVAWFYSLLQDAIDRESATFEGQSEVDGTPVRRRVNAAEGRYQGVEASVALHVWRLTLSSSFTWTEGELTNAKGETSPASKVPPPFGTAGLRYDHPGEDAYVEVVARFAAAQHDINPEDQVDPRICETAPYSGRLRTPCDSAPGWFALGVRGGWRFIPNLRADLSLSNVLDSRYRVYGSGVDATGIDGRATLTASF